MFETDINPAHVDYLMDIFDNNDHAASSVPIDNTPYESPNRYNRKSKIKKDKIYYLIDITKKIDFDVVKWKEIVQLSRNNDIKTIYFTDIPFIPEHKKDIIVKIRTPVKLHDIIF